MSGGWRDDVRLASAALTRRPRWAAAAVYLARVLGALGPARRIARSDPARSLDLW